jgi:hypothetical protein
MRLALSGRQWRDVCLIGASAAVIAYFPVNPLPVIRPSELALISSRMVLLPPRDQRRAERHRFHNARIVAWLESAVLWAVPLSWPG